MPLFRFRLDAQDGSGHYRQGSISAESEAAAREYLIERELKYVAYSDPDIGKSEAEEAAPGKTSALTRAHLAMHRQDKPYKLSSLKAVEE